MADRLPRHEQTYDVRFDECGPDGMLPASGYLRYAQDLAWRHSDHLGFGREWYARRGLTWLIRALEIELLGTVEYGERLSATTEVRGFRRVWARRGSEVRREAGGPAVARMTIDWVLLNSTGTPTRIPDEITHAFAVPASGGFGPLRVRLHPPPAPAHRQELRPRRGELDPMAHVNNAVYLDYLDEQLATSGRGAQLERLPRCYSVEFVAPAEPGMDLHGQLWQEDTDWLYRLESAEGRELLRARLSPSAAA